jgi:hypothetical protein
VTDKDMPSAGSALASDRRRNEIAICVLIGLAYVRVWPVGRYAVVDEWAFVKSLERLHFDRQVRILDWNPMSLVDQVVWGFLFTNIFGFSFTVARISVVALCVAECIALLRLLALCGVERNLALAGAVSLFFNPLHFVHAFTYTTDLPAIAWEVVAMFCYVKGLTVAERAVPWMLAGSLAAGEAFLTRQHGILVPVALLTYLVAFARPKCTASFVLSAFGPATLAITGWTLWYERIHGPTSTNMNSMRLLLDFLADPPLDDLPYVALTFLVYAGWFLIPLAAAAPLGSLRLGTRSLRIIFGCVAWAGVNALAYYAFVSGDLFPYLADVVTPNGYYFVGEFILGRRPFLWGRPSAAIVSIVSVLAALALAYRLLAARVFRAGPGPGAIGDQPAPRVGADSAAPALPPAAIAVRLLSILFALQLAYAFATSPILFDRHLLVFAPTVVALFCILSRRSGPVRLIPYLACLAPFAFYGIAATHDLHALSRAAFHAGEDLAAAGVDPAQINGGYAFDGWYGYESRARRVEKLTSFRPWWRGTSAQHIAFDESNPEAEVLLRRRQWWAGLISAGVKAKYLVSCSPPRQEFRERLKTKRTYEYVNWWPPGTRAAYVVVDSENRK